MRLNKYLAFHLGISRRAADELITDQRVQINGATAQIGQQALDSDVISVDGELVLKKTEYDYYLLNKPVGYVSSGKQQGDTPTLYDLLPPELHHLKIVGRLDRDSSGLMLLTDDGELAQTLTHPRFQKVKVYDIILDKPLAPLHQQMISDHGIQLDDGVSKFLVESITNGYRVTMREGRNRQIRRTFMALGHTVTSLHRIQMGNLHLANLASSHYERIAKP